MKKRKVVSIGVFVIMMSMIITGCGHTNNDGLSNDSYESTEIKEPTHSHRYSEATCTEAAKCSCGIIKGDAHGHNFEKGVCTWCNAKIDEEDLSHIVITNDNWKEYFGIVRKDIVPDKNAFGEYGTPEDMYYILEMQLKKEYADRLVSIDVSIEVVLDTDLRSYYYDKATGVGIITDDYRKEYNNTDTEVCNFRNDKAAYICACHYADSLLIDGKTVYYAYICESVNCVRAVGTISVQEDQ